LVFSLGPRLRGGDEEAKLDRTVVPKTRAPRFLRLPCREDRRGLWRCAAPGILWPFGAIDFSLRTVRERSLLLLVFGQPNRPAAHRPPLSVQTPDHLGGVASSETAGERSRQNWAVGCSSTGTAS
jgi:hypothetical protein